MSSVPTPGGGAFGCFTVALLIAAPTYFAVHIVIALVGAVVS